MSSENESATAKKLNGGVIAGIIAALVILFFFFPLLVIIGVIAFFWGGAARRWKLKKWVIAILIYVAMSWISSLLPVRVEMMVTGYNNAPVVFETIVMPELETLVKVHHQALSKEKGTVFIECASMSRKDRAQFHELLNKLSKGKHYIDWDATKPSFGFSGDWNFFLKKSVYTLKLLEVPKERVSVIVIGKDKNILNEIHTYLKESFSKLEVVEDRIKGGRAIRYSLDIVPSDINNSLIPKLSGFGDCADGYDPIERSISFFLTGEAEDYEIDCTQIADLKKRGVAQNIFGDSHTPIIKRHYSPAAINAKRNMLTRKGFLGASEWNEEGKCYKMTVTELTPQTEQVVIHGDIQNAEALGKLLEELGDLAPTRPENTPTGSLKLDITYYDESMIQEIQRELPKNPLFRIDSRKPMTIAIVKPSQQRPVATAAGTAVAVSRADRRAREAALAPTPPTKLAPLGSFAQQADGSTLSEHRVEAAPQAGKLVPALGSFAVQADGSLLSEHRVEAASKSDKTIPALGSITMQKDGSLLSEYAPVKIPPSQLGVEYVAPVLPFNKK